MEVLGRGEKIAPSLLKKLRVFVEKGRGEPSMANEIYGEWKCPCCGKFFVATSHDYIAPECPFCGTKFRARCEVVFPSLQLQGR